MNKPIYLSVVLCTYNEERYIMDSVLSILNQTYPYFELIIVNDGSTDKTKEILETLNDKRIRIINKQNTGLPHSLNVGISHAKYDWIARMDGDDIALPNRFADQIKLIEQGYDIIGGQFLEIDGDGVMKSTICSRKPVCALKCKLFVFLGWNPLAHPTAIIKKNILEKMGGYDENFKASQDLELWSRLSHCCKIINSNEVVLKYRKHANNISNSKKDKQIFLGFMAFVKYALKIRKPLNFSQFDMLTNDVFVKKCIYKNRKKFDKTHSSVGFFRKLCFFDYYVWRLWTFISLRIRCSKYHKFIMI